MNKKKVKFNIVDIIVILILIAGAVFVGTRVLGGEESSSDASNPASASTYYVTFFAECIPETVADSLVEGSRAENVSQILDLDTLAKGSRAEIVSQNIDLGTLVEFTTAPSIVYGFDSNGICVQSEKPGYVSVTLTCEVTGIQQPTGLQLDQFMLNIGRSMNVRCGNTEIDTIVQNIAPANAG